MKAKSEAEIHEFWNREATRYAHAISALRDENQAILEYDLLLKELASTKKEKLLEVGCGNGYGIELFSRFKDVALAWGIDYAENFIKQAKKRQNKKTRFKVANVRALSFIAEYFDVVVSKRCLINLPSWEAQKKAVMEIYRVLKKNGVFLMLEASKQGYSTLNIVRETMGLPKIGVAWHDLPIDEERLKEFETYFTIRGGPVFNAYYFISRIIHPLVVYPEEPKYDAKINVVARKVEEQLDMDISVSPVIFYEFVKR